MHNEIIFNMIDKYVIFSKIKYKTKYDAFFSIKLSMKLSIILSFA